MQNSTYSLERLIGQKITIHLLNHLVAETNKPEVAEMKLLGVESSGLWVESTYFTKFILNDQPAMEKTPVFFLPFSQIGFVVHLAD